MVRRGNNDGGWICSMFYSECSMVWNCPNKSKDQSGWTQHAIMHCSLYVTYLGTVLISPTVRSYQTKFHLFVGHAIIAYKTECRTKMNTVKSHYYKILAPILLKDLHNHLVWCIKQSSAQLAQSSCNCLENIILSNQVRIMTVRFGARPSTFAGPSILPPLNRTLWVWLKYYSLSLAKMNGKELLSVSDE